MKIALQKAVHRSDASLWILDATYDSRRQAVALEAVAKVLQDSTGPVLMVLNKVDLLNENRLEISRQGFQKFGAWDMVLVSAVQGKGLEPLVTRIAEVLPEGPPLYPQGQISDMPERFFVEEALRQAMLTILREEVPHATAPLVESFRENEEGPLYIKTVLYVEKNSQRGILIGKGGSTLRNIGQKARKSLEIFFGRRVFLDLWVKVAKNWRKDEVWLSRLGFEKPGPLISRSVPP